MDVCKWLGHDDVVVNETDSSKSYVCKRCGRGWGHGGTCSVINLTPETMTAMKAKYNNCDCACHPYNANHVNGGACNCTHNEITDWVIPKEIESYEPRHKLSFIFTCICILMLCVANTFPRTNSDIYNAFIPALVFLSGMLWGNIFARLQHRNELKQLLKHAKIENHFLTHLLNRLKEATKLNTDIK